MALVLARFLYGFSLSWIVVAVLIAATLLCIRLVGIAVVAFDQERKGDIAGAACVAVVIVAALAAIGWLGGRLYDALGASALVGGTAHWLAGGNTLSPAAIFGALAGFGSLAGMRAWMNRPPRDPALARGKAADKAAAKAERGSARADGASSGGKTRAAASKARAKAAAPARGPRIPQLGWSALFLLLLGAAVFAFAYGVDPLSVPPDATAAAARIYRDMAMRARPVYLAAAVLLGTGAVLALLWFFWRRRPER
ncbi:hypothetical protein [Bordetella bronchialis]|uniref:Uncharacterized protein n=1 Tax=Bordetella bronchialis TaxID=463025 RepID=A0A193FGT2_9BORD|nr:hypothetical protein [Bordetella bronchialis]ANN66319.1 hypothetical protein BAU06_08470 [Bordetella bronchialis]ANN71399.1 hypothetical protein BAU08_08695 [Bordetella bronchialis]